uniref:Leishmanolysin-like peptidase n=1 Tax=Coturnix japonica TaxID=93934 RepID=A0A8C2UD21_COTJA
MSCIAPQCPGRRCPDHTCIHCLALHCIALHCIALHCVALYCIALHCIALHCIALHCIALHCIVLHCIVLHCSALHCIVLHCIALYCIALHCIALHCIALHCIASCCTALYGTALHCVALHCIALHCIALHCIASCCTALCCTALCCTAVHCIALLCIALCCIALHCIALLCIALHCIASHGTALLSSPSPRPPLLLPLDEPHPITISRRLRPALPLSVRPLIGWRPLHGRCLHGDAVAVHPRWPPGRSAGVAVRLFGRCCPRSRPPCCWAAAAPTASPHHSPQRPVSTECPAAGRCGLGVPQAVRGGGVSMRGRCEGSGGGFHTEGPQRVLVSGQVLYGAPVREGRVMRRSVDQRLRIKIIYDRSNKLFPQAISYLEKTFQVRKSTGTILLSRQCATNQYLRRKADPHRYCRGACANHTRCGPVIVPEKHLQQCRVYNQNEQLSDVPDQEGVRDADFVLYVSALTTDRCGHENIIAYAAYCQLEAEMDRPIAGYANLCPNMISTQPQEFVGMLSTVKHEIIHALGFSAGLFAFYRDDDGKPLTARYADGLPPFNESLGLYQWSDKVVQKAVRLWDVRGGRMLRHAVYLLKTRRVVEEARKHFDCPILEGMELENQGGMGTELNHWEKRLLENEAMTGSHTQNRVFSRITLALMEDTGRQLISPYCDTLRSNPLQLTCRQDQRAVAVCNLQKFPKQLPQEYQYFDNLSGVPAEDLPYYGGSVEIADYCPFSQEFSWHLSGEFQRSSDCRIIENQPDPTKNYGAEEYGPNSVCLIQKSAFVMEQCRRKLSYPDWGSGCYQVSCSPQGLHVWVKDTAYLCSRSGQVLTVSIQMNGWVHVGNLICPACWDFCDSCPPERDPPALNLSRAAATDLCSCSSSLVVTLWLLMANLIPLVTGLFLCA